MTRAYKLQEAAGREDILETETEDKINVSPHSKDVRRRIVNTSQRINTGKIIVKVGKRL